MQDYDLSTTDWRKSSRSNGYGGNCVEVALTRQVIGVRDSKDRGGGTLTFAADRWHTFVTGLKRS
ncbi:DUF397 domain-containing protein [Saccharopolyspora sp. K220]|uniref:DUF397 domain-containing protein n=1 Tax=Saccharopolyspora soli TaxID=2926618 RepID=UPI001F5A62DD|nr:DUF397 domain-containing protein [Saccharopolyspora soli]MCI2418685.1 DUF397 domain-containing protein [Saccharopolyspora soli]